MVDQGLFIWSIFSTWQADNHGHMFRLSDSKMNLEFPSGQPLVSSPGVLQKLIGIKIQTQTIRHTWIEETDIKPLVQSHPYICSYLNRRSEMNLCENNVKLLVMCYYGNNEQAASLSFHHLPWAPRCSTWLLIHVKGQNALHNFFFATWFWFKLDRDYLKFNMVPDD